MLSYMMMSRHMLSLIFHAIVFYGFVGPDSKQTVEKTISCSAGKEKKDGYDNSQGCDAPGDNSFVIYNQQGNSNDRSDGSVGNAHVGCHREMV
jgi:hypothetical protein